MITVECVWGDGPDILMTIPHSHGGGPRRMVDLTLAEAEKLIIDLRRATYRVGDLNRLCDEHDEKHVRALGAAGLLPGSSFTVCEGCGALLADAGIDRCPSCMHPL